MNLRGARPALAATFRAAALVVATSGALLLGCGESREQEPIPVEESVFGDQVETIQRAQDQVDDMGTRKQDLDAQLERDEGAPRNDPEE